MLSQYHQSRTVNRVTQEGRHAQRFPAVHDARQCYGSGRGGGGWRGVWRCGYVVRHQHSYSVDLGGGGQARLLRFPCDPQRRRRFLWRISDCLVRFGGDFLGGVLCHSGAHERLKGPGRAQCHARRPHQQEMPGMSERNTGGRPPLRLLYIRVGCAREAEKRLGFPGFRASHRRIQSSLTSLGPAFNVYWSVELTPHLEELKMRKLAVMFLMLGCTVAFAGDKKSAKTDPWVGDWKMDVSKSQFPTPGPKEETLTIAAATETTVKNSTK